MEVLGKESGIGQSCPQPAFPNAAAAMIGRPTVQPNCQHYIRDYLYDVVLSKTLH
jgi:hypothetical protein